MSSSTVHDSQRFYIEIWMWLVGLLAVGTVVVFLPVPKNLALLVVFAVAAVKAVLVVRNYMHLKAEHLIIYLIVLVPTVLIVGMLIALMPDIAFRW
ncbi:MAG: cytochrome C oxidase subunit IV family protein [Candidatus Binataceae bacterium]